MKIIFKLVLLLILCSTLTFTACETSDDEVPPNTYEIGDIGPSGVGIVFYIEDDGLHGLEAALNDNYTAIMWIWSDKDNKDIAISTLPDIWEGAQNTKNITGSNGLIGGAANGCRRYSNGGKDDWFLPSLHELQELYKQKAVVGGFADANYWSSHAYNNYNGYYVDFSTGNIGNADKDETYRTRPVRAF